MNGREGGEIKLSCEDGPNRCIVDGQPRKASNEKGGRDFPMSTFSYHHDLSRVEEGCIIRFLSSPPGSGTSCWAPQERKDQRIAPPAPALWAPYTRLTWISAGRCSWMMYQGPNLQSGAWQKVVAKGSCEKMLGEDGAWQRNIKTDALVPRVFFRPLAKTFMHSARLVS